MIRTAPISHEWGWIVVKPFLAFERIALFAGDDNACSAVHHLAHRLSTREKNQRGDFARSHNAMSNRSSTFLFAILAGFLPLTAFGQAANQAPAPPQAAPPVAPATTTTTTTTTAAPAPATTATTSTTETVPSEGIVLQTRVFVVRNGKQIPLDRDLVLPDGTRVAVDGTITASDGRILTVPRGHMLSTDGRLIPAPPLPDVGVSGLGPATGSISGGPARGTVSSGPATGTISTGPATGVISSGPARGNTSTGPARGTQSSGPSTGTPSTGPATGGTRSSDR